VDAVAAVPAAAGAGEVDAAAGVVAAVPAAAGADGVDAAAGAVAAGAADLPPRPSTYETRAFISAAFTLTGTMPAAFIWAVGVFRTAVSFAGGYRVEV